MSFSNWREYQDEVASFFRRQGCDAEVEKQVQGVRAKHDIDVYVTFFRSGIKCTWVVECKLWKTRVPKEKVMALRTIVEDLGADRGIIVSESGFQSGALDAVRDSNITLVTSLEEFERTTSSGSSEQHLVYIESEVPLYKFPDESKPQNLLRYNDFLISANWGSGTISIINPRKRVVVRTIELDNYEARSPVTADRVIRKYPPGSMAIAEGRLFVGQVFSEFLLVIDVETLSIVKRLHIPGGGEGEITASADEKTIFFASNKENQFYIINSATYKYHSVQYPSGGRGCMSISVHPDGSRLYIGVQRGGLLNGKSYFGGNCFLAVYDLNRSTYVTTIYLAEIYNGCSDDATPACIEVDSEGKKIYVGMFQSKRGICVIDAISNEIVNDIRFERNEYNKHFEWVDPLSVKSFGECLISLNRNNCELLVINKNDYKTVKSYYLGEAPNGPKDIELFDNEVFVSYPEKNGFVVLNLSLATLNKSMQPNTNASDD